LRGRHATSVSVVAATLLCQFLLSVAVFAQETGLETTSEDQHSSSVEISKGETGGTELENGQVVAEGQVGGSLEGTVSGDAGTVSGEITAGAEGQVRVGDDGVEASGSIGLAAELEAISERIGVGDEDFGASGQVSAKVNALIGAEGRIGAYIDDKGITIGAEGSVGAYVSAEVALDFEAHVFGVQTNIKVVAEGHAGLLAQGEAAVTLGYDGRISFKLGAGVSVGIGGSVTVSFEVDASKLLDELGLTDLAELLVWLDDFVANPEERLADIADEALRWIVDEALAAAEEAVEDLADAVGDVIDDVMDTLSDISDGIGDGLSDWLSGLVNEGTDDGDLPPPDPEGPFPGHGGDRGNWGGDGPAEHSRVRNLHYERKLESWSR